MTQNIEKPLENKRFFGSLSVPQAKEHPQNTKDGSYQRSYNADWRCFIDPSRSYTLEDISAFTGIDLFELDLIAQVRILRAQRRGSTYQAKGADVLEWGETMLLYNDVVVDLTDVLNAPRPPLPDRGHVKGQNDRKAQGRAHAAVSKAIREGTLVRSERCERCEDEPGNDTRGYSKIVAHHHKGYENPLDVQWLCVRCNNVLGRVPDVDKRRA